ncbi:CZB domain-containing protein [Salmonella enterica]|nr:chemotaxis protein [Salmonella enterica subsp. diarizonae]ECQ2679912.1 chemotaxis protein [Salmonella enterica]EIE2751085.1 CZB domain-containing protein [Salmonella enterica subsp. diarizonae serovar 48:i:z]ECJ4781293.1 chemotaxis protein [Salmonella enterica subsp. diarizonae]EDQ7409154.1 chemotaxis protein [Salmonella enterica subsp. diarizonae]
MAPESTEKEKLQHVYRLQQSKLVSISNLTETLGNIRENLEVFSAEQNTLTGELENCTNRSRLTIRRLERKGNKEENEENIEDDDYRLLSPSRKKSFLHTLQDVHDVTSSVAGRLYRLSSRQKYSAELLDLSVITVKHFLWRERVFMAIILGGHDSAELKQVSVRSCALGRWYDGRGKKAYSHLPAYRSLGEVHTRYHEVLNELIDRGVEGMTFHEMSEELAKLEMLSQQIVGFTGQIRHHISLLQNAQSS